MLQTGNGKPSEIFTISVVLLEMQDEEVEVAPGQKITERFNVCDF